MSQFSPGSLVHARGREWVVQPESASDLLVVRPLGGVDAETTGIWLPLEPVRPAKFSLPSPDQIGDHNSCRLLRDAVRLASRSSAGPFRSFGRIAVEPRPYQLVPLMMALRMDPIRLFVADDVGIGKTVEACLIVRELLDRGEITTFTVLAPPHLVTQWQTELATKFHIEAAAVLAGNVARLERECRAGQSLFEAYPFTIVSMDFIKSERRRHEFIQHCPEMVLVDEAHTCAWGGETARSNQQRHALLEDVCRRADRHILLVSATPHSGDEQAFRSLLKLLNPNFAALPSDLSGDANRSHRERLARHFVQRKRADIAAYLGDNTKFPKRNDLLPEPSYKLHADYRKLFDRVWQYTRESISTAGENKGRQRVRWWAALGLLRSLASSPAAAAETLRNRAPGDDLVTDTEADDAGREVVLDVEAATPDQAIDTPAGALLPGDEDEASTNRRKLLDLARLAESLKGNKDHKLIEAVKLLKKLIDDGFRPIVFCRFIPTAEYLAEELRSRLHKSVAVGEVTGKLVPEERQARVAELGKAEKPVLVCTDCLSEGINLQDQFDAVLHYDLAWNPVRHEQREGRVDRFGQRKTEVRVVTYYGIDNGIDGLVLEVLLRRHKAIRSDTGVSVPVPTQTEDMLTAMFNSAMLRGEAGDANQLFLPGFGPDIQKQRKQVDQQWQSAADREKLSRSVFAQRTIDPNDVSRELSAARAAVGAGVDVRRFVEMAVKVHGGMIKGDKILSMDLSHTPRTFREALSFGDELSIRFDFPAEDDELVVGRTHPLVERLAGYLLDTALDPALAGLAKRAGVISTKAVTKRTTVLLLRCRYDLIIGAARGPVRTLIAEDCFPVGFVSAPEQAQWLAESELEPLLAAEPSGNVSPQQARSVFDTIVNGYPALRPKLDEFAKGRAASLLEAHQRVRSAAELRVSTRKVEPHLPADVLGLFVFLPVGS